MKGKSVSLLFCIQITIQFHCDTDGRLTVQQKQELLDHHNALRAKVCNGLEKKQPKCSNVVAMKWDDRLEKDAQRLADSCHKDHDKWSQREIKPYENIGTGQNMALGFSNLSVGITNLFRELENFHHKNNGCDGNITCGHYTQIMQFDSFLVGCGYKDDCKTTFKRHLICNYIAASNRGVDLKIYKIGEPCSNCPPGFGFCMNGLCVPKSYCKGKMSSQCSCKIKKCQNGGTFNSKTCYCDCPSGFDGSTCAEPCKDIFAYCHPVMCKSTHKGFLEAIQLCRKTCKFCNKFFLPKDKKQSNQGGIKTRVANINKLKSVGIIPKRPKKDLTPITKLGKWKVVKDFN